MRLRGSLVWAMAQGPRRSTFDPAPLCESHFDVEANGPVELHFPRYPSDPPPSRLKVSAKDAPHWAIDDLVWDAKFVRASFSPWVKRGDEPPELKVLVR